MYSSGGMKVESQKDGKEDKREREERRRRRNANSEIIFERYNYTTN